jgi:hypothetical protein
VTRLLERSLEMRGKSQLSAVEKLTLVRRFEAGERASALALEVGVLAKSLYQWRAAYLLSGVAGLDRKRGRKPGGRAAAAPSSSPAAGAACSATIWMGRRRRSGKYFDGRGGLMIVAARQDCKRYFVGA